MEEPMIEETYSGFCKALNETRTVFCEFEEKDGKRILSSADCAYGACPHSKICLLMKQMEEEL
ncbi:MAG: ubiquinone biosynthesis protein UbiE [Lachnospiraceae bacterium]|nr:ubiquinone biosynthesis protein UbiE [Lachnospiraceae bacterium]